jgi:hypothetical protein
VANPVRSVVSLGFETIQKLVMTSSLYVAVKHKYSPVFEATSSVGLVAGTSLEED